MFKIILIALAMSSTALADGFVCNTMADQFTVKVFHHTDAADGTRNAAVMVLSDNTVAYGRRTIARFTSGETLTNQGAHYIARVDHRYNDSNRVGELIAGTKIKYLKNILLDIDFSYFSPMMDGEMTEGILRLVKRNGEVITLMVECERYLKN